MANYKLVTEQLVEWIQNQVRNAGAKGCILGLSGGIDSAVTSVLCKRAFPHDTFGLMMPAHSNSQDLEDAILNAETFGISYKIVDLSGTFDELCRAIGGTEDLPKTSLTLHNIKPRLRMTTLYYHAALYNYLVVGTDNRSELRVGYFTKYGDGGVDIVPIGNLVKTQVRELAQYLGIPERVIAKAPTAGLWEQQTDESEMGVTYAELDRYILTGEGEPRVKEIVDRLHARSQHKLQAPPKPDFNIE